MADKTSVQRGGKSLQTKVRNVTRTMTTGTALASLPKGARIIGYILGGTASDAGTTATLSFGTTTTATEHVNGLDVKTAGTGSGLGLLRGVTGALPAVLTSDTVIYAKYAESGTASTAGSWTVTILYTTGNITNDDTI